MKAKSLFGWIAGCIILAIPIASMSFIDSAYSLGGEGVLLHFKQFAIVAIGSIAVWTYAEKVGKRHPLFLKSILHMVIGSAALAFLYYAAIDHDVTSSTAVFALSWYAWLPLFSHLLSSSHAD